jgi:hypothetical protein
MRIKIMFTYLKVLAGSNLTFYRWIAFRILRTAGPMVMGAWGVDTLAGFEVILGHELNKDKINFLLTYK